MLANDAFKILGIESTCDKKEIRAAYRKLLPSCNPEEDEEKFLLLRTAYDTAMDYAQDEIEDMSPWYMEHLREQEQTETTEKIPQNEKVIRELIVEIESLYQDRAQRNDPGKWTKLLENDIFLSIDYREQAKKEILRCLSDKYLLKTSILKLIYEKMQLHYNDANLWGLAPTADTGFVEYIFYFVNKLRDVSDYTDFLYDEVQSQDLRETCQILLDCLKAREKEQFQGFTENLTKCMHEQFEIKDGDVLCQIEEMIKRHPESIYWRLLAVRVCEAGEEDGKGEKIACLVREILAIFVESRIKDSRFLHWQFDYADSVSVYPNERCILLFSAFGEYLLGLDFFMKNPIYIRLLENGEDRLLARSFLEIQSALQAKLREEKNAFWRNATKGLTEVLKVRPEEKSALYLRMMAESELYDFDAVQECYTRALKLIPDNAGIYTFFARAHDFTDRRKEAGHIFEEAKKNHAGDYRLKLQYLCFRQEYDFIDGYDLEKPLALARHLLREMNYYGVGGGLLAEAYYTMGRLMLSDARYNNAQVYFMQALQIQKKAEYLFWAALDCIRNRNYEAARDFLEEIYQNRESWADSESSNPMFAGHRDGNAAWSVFLESFHGTDLCNLCVKLGLCYEHIGVANGDAGSCRKAVRYYKEALMIQPDSIKLGSAIARVVGGLLERGGISPLEAEGELKGLLQQSQNLYSIKWLRALIAFKNGDEKAAAGFAVEVSKRKNEKSDDIDWVYFSEYLLARIYRKQGKEMLAAKHIGASLDGFGAARRSKIPDNRLMIKQICADAAAWYSQLGMTKEAKAVTRDLKRFE